MENRKKKWYDLLGLIPKNLTRLLLIISIFPVILAIILIVYAWRANQFDMAEVVAPLQNSAAYDRKGEFLGILSDAERVYVGWDDIPKDLVNAFVAREDEEFFNHDGIVYLSMLRSFWVNISTWSIAQGGSTITMQLARNCYELGGRNIDRKVLELAVARRIEKEYKKEDIFTAYLNRIYFGRQCYGIAQAASYYFGKSVSQLTLPECATLAGLVRGPSIFNPVDNHTRSIWERNTTLNRMQACGFITSEEAEQAKNAPMIVNKNRDRRPGSYPALFASRELSELKDVDMDSESTSSIFVLTYFDLAYQRKVEELCEALIKELESTPEWAKLPKRQDNDVSNCLQVAVMCVETRSGGIAAVAGGRTALDGIDRWQNKIKPGLLFSPVVNVAAIDKGRNVIRNNPTVTGTSVGYQSVIDMARKLGIEDPLPRSDDLYLGNFSLRLQDMFNALFLIHRDGKNIKISSIRKIGTCKHKLLLSNELEDGEKNKELIPRESAQLVTTQPPFFGDDKGKLVSLQVDLPENQGHVAAKAGNHLSVFVWVGFDEANPEWYAKGKLRNILNQFSLKLADQLYKQAFELQEKTQEPK